MEWLGRFFSECVSECFPLGGAEFAFDSSVYLLEGHATGMWSGS